MLIWFAGYGSDVKLIDRTGTWPPAALDRKVRLGSYFIIFYFTCAVLFDETLCHTLWKVVNRSGANQISNNTCRHSHSQHDWVYSQVSLSLKCCNVMDSPAIFFYDLSPCASDSLHHFKTVKLILSSFFMHRFAACAHLPWQHNRVSWINFSFTFNSY